MANALEMYQEALRRREEAKNVNNNAIPQSGGTGYKGNPIERTLGTITHASDNITTGAVKGIEGVVDAGASLAGVIGSLFGADTTWADDFVKRDLTNEFKSDIAGKIVYNTLVGGANFLNLLPDIGNIVNNVSKETKSGMNLFESLGNNLEESTRNKINYSYVNELPEVGQEVFNGVTSSIGQMLPAIATGGIAGGAGLSSLAIKILSGGVFGASAMGTSTEEALQSGNDLGTAVQYGALQGAKELGTEYLGGKLFGSKLFGVFGKGTTKVGTQTVKSVIKEVGKQSFGEGMEEVLGDAFEPLIKKMTINKDDKLSDLYVDSAKSMPVDFITGAITGGVFSGGSAISNISTYGVEGSRVLETITEANSVVKEIVKLEKSNQRNDAKTVAKIEELKNELIELNEDYTKQLQAVKDKYGESSSKAQKINEFKGYMDDSTTSSAQDLVIREAINSANKKYKKKISYQSLNQEEFDKKVNQYLGEGAEEGYSDSNAIVDKNGNIFVNKNGEAYKSGKLYSVIGHEVIHTIEDTKEYEILYNKFVQELSEKEKNSILKEYQDIYGEQTEAYLLEEAFATYVGENVTVNYKEFSKMLGVDSRLSKLKEKIFGYKGVLNSEKRTLQSEVKEGIKNSTSKESEELKASRNKNSSGRKKNPKRRALANAANAIDKYGIQVHSDIMRQLRVYYRNNESRIANSFVAISGNDLYIIDSGIEENGEINYGVYDVLHIDSDVDVDDYRNELESEIKENGGYRKSPYNTKHSSRKVSNIVGHEDTLHGQGPSTQGVRTSNGTSSNDTGRVSGSSGSSGNGTRRTNVLLDETKGTELGDTQVQKEEVKFSKNKSDGTLFHDIFEILGITKNRKVD